MNQRTLFDAGPRRMKRTRTQNDAWRAVQERLPELRGKVYGYIAGRGAWGATRKEIAAGLGMPLQTVCGRANELLGGKDGAQFTVLIYQTDESRSGSKVLRILL